MTRDIEAIIEYVSVDITTGYNDLIDLVGEHMTNKRNGFNLERSIEGATKKQRMRLLRGLKDRVQYIVRELEDDIPMIEDEEEACDRKEDACEAALACCIVGRVLLQSCSAGCDEKTGSGKDKDEGIKLPLQQFDSAEMQLIIELCSMLHDHALLNVPDFPVLQEEVMKLCEECWQLEIDGRERLVAQTIPFMLMSALENGTWAAAKRCYVMRHALDLFEFDDGSAIDLKKLLLRVAFAPLFLRCVEGRKFIAHTFSLHPDFVRDLGKIVRNQVPCCRTSVLDEYGDVLFRAWSGASGPCKYEIEGLIQSLIDSAFLATTSTISGALRRVLRGIYCHKIQPCVDKMLVSVFEPILYRRLKAANPKVRKNAFEVLSDAFPLRDPDDSPEEMDERINQQFAAMDSGLKDKVPQVRASAARCIFHVLDSYWEMIPAGVTARYLKVLAEDLAYDAAAPIVRATIPKGFSNLLQNSLTHSMIRLTIPALSNMRIDPCASVRAEFIQFIHVLANHPEFDWNTVVTLEDLLDSLAVETYEIAAKIQKVLIPTYFPDRETGPALVAELLQEKPEAGLAFLCNLAGVSYSSGQDGLQGMKEHVTPAVGHQDLISLASDLAAHLWNTEIETKSVNTKSLGKQKSKSMTKKSRRKNAAENISDNVVDEEHGKVLEKPETWHSIAEGLMIVCIGLGHMVRKGKLDTANTQRIFTSTQFKDLSKRSREIDSDSVIFWVIAAALPHSSGAGNVRKECVGFLIEKSARKYDSIQLKAALECILAPQDAVGRLLMNFGDMYSSNICLENASMHRKAKLAYLDPLKSLDIVASSQLLKQVFKLQYIEEQKDIVSLIKGIVVGMKEAAEDMLYMSDAGQAALVTDNLPSLCIYCFLMSVKNEYGTEGGDCSIDTAPIEILLEIHDLALTHDSVVNLDWSSALDSPGCEKSVAQITHQYEQLLRLFEVSSSSLHQVYEIFKALDLDSEELTQEVVCCCEKLLQVTLEGLTEVCQSSMKLPKEFTPTICATLRLTESLLSTIPVESWTEQVIERIVQLGCLPIEGLLPKRILGQIKSIILVINKGYQGLTWLSTAVEMYSNELRRQGQPLDGEDLVEICAPFPLKIVVQECKSGRHSHGNQFLWGLEVSFKTAPNACMGWLHLTTLFLGKGEVCKALQKMQTSASGIQEECLATLLENISLCDRDY